MRMAERNMHYQSEIYQIHDQLNHSTQATIENNIFIGLFALRLTLKDIPCSQITISYMLRTKRRQKNKQQELRRTTDSTIFFSSKYS